MQRLPAGGPVEVAGQAYRQARRKVRDMTDMRLRWEVRSLLRQRTGGTLPDGGLIRLQAAVDEHKARTGHLPE
jgi:hypothetical protein